MVMPSGITNAPSTFIGLMNHVMKPFLGKCFMVYFDDILIYIKSLDEHIEHLKADFDVFRKEKRYANLETCLYRMDEVVFLGFIVRSRGVEVDESE